MTAKLLAKAGAALCGLCLLLPSVTRPITGGGLGYMWTRLMASRRIFMKMAASACVLPAIGCAQKPPQRVAHHRAAMRLCLPSPRLLFALHSLPPRIVEIGAGDGMWLAIMQYDGIDCVGVDINPRGANVIKASHAETANMGNTMLAVWPPDGEEINKWISVKRWDAIVICGNILRIRIGSPIDDYRLVDTLPLSDTLGGTNVARIWRSA